VSEPAILIIIMIKVISLGFYGRGDSVSSRGGLLILILILIKIITSFREIGKLRKRFYADKVAPLLV
jgi:hypothetical protein